MDQPGTQFEHIVRLMREAQYARANEACDQLARVLPATGSFEAGLFFLSGCALVSAIVTLVAVRERRSRVEPAGVGMTPA